MQLEAQNALVAEELFAAVNAKDGELEKAAQDEQKRQFVAKGHELAESSAADETPQPETVAEPKGE